MSREDFVAVAVRLVAVYIVFSVLAWLLWMFPLTVARKLLPVMRDTHADLSFSAPLALSLGLTLMGVWLVLGSSGWQRLFFRLRYGSPDAYAASASGESR